MSVNSKLRILIIDDSPLCVKILEDSIQKLPWGAEKETAAFFDAESGLAYLEKITVEGAGLPDFIILDLELPGQHGLEVLKKIKMHPLWRGIPVIVNSSSEKREDFLGAYKQGGLIFMRKNNDVKALEQVIGQMKMMGFLKK